MFSFSFKNRIALYYLIATAALVMVVFVIIYKVVEINALSEVNEDLRIEQEKHQADAEKLKDTRHLVLPEEWEEREHRDILVNPVFVQVHDIEGRFLENSPNLNGAHLGFHFPGDSTRFRDTLLGKTHIRQIETPLFLKGKKIGYAVIAMSTEAAVSLIDNLRLVLFITFPIVLFVLFFVTRILAGRSISPALNVISTTKRLTDNNFNERIPLPRNKDELYTLSLSINNLLDRIESAIEREKQFTSDASHELRTPLAVIKGTLEVLRRKPRDIKEYEEKIDYCINEVNRVNHLVDQLLLLARFESQKGELKLQQVALNEVILESLQRFSSKIASGGIVIDFTFSRHHYVTTDEWLTSILIDNLLSNAIKYSPDSATITISLQETPTEVVCTIADNGMGIAPEELQRVYEQFYRSEATQHPEIKGTGLGLSLVKRLSKILDVKVELSSTLDRGTTASLSFAKNI